MSDTAIDTATSDQGAEPRAAVHPTATAQAKIRELLANEPAGSVLVVGARPGGCSGLSWEMYFDTTDGVDLDNSEVTVYDGFTVVIDTTTATLAAGSTLEYRDGLTGGFHIDNPSATRTCGCGQSFS